MTDLDLDHVERQLLARAFVHESPRDFQAGVQAAVSAMRPAVVPVVSPESPGLPATHKILAS